MFYNSYCTGCGCLFIQKKPGGIHSPVPNEGLSQYSQGSSRSDLFINSVKRFTSDSSSNHSAMPCLNYAVVKNIFKCSSYPFGTLGRIERSLCYRYDLDCSRQFFHCS